MREQTENNPERTGSVKRRIVFYIPGYDPIPPRRYRELYRSEGAAQAEISGYDLQVAGRTGASGYGWTVRYGSTDALSTAQIEFLQWNDIVKDSMKFNILQTYVKMFGTLGYYIRTGVLWRLFRLRPQPMIAALYPVIMLSSQLGLAALAGRILRHSTENIPGIPFALALSAGLVFSTAILMLFRKYDGPIYAYYLALDYVFSAQNGGRLPNSLAQRLSQFATQIKTALSADYDEILIVGHSTGAHMAVDVAAEVLRDAPPTKHLSLLTLGQVIPMVSFLPHAQGLRRALHDLSQDPRLTWVDVSAPGDGACFALSDPVTVSGVDPAPDKKLWPRVISAAFSESLSSETLNKTKWRFFRRHIQYLWAFDYPRGYDYFAITAGPLTLRQRYGDRGSTATRDARVLSPFTDM